MSEVSVEMPQYVCHKKVWALKIESVTTYDAGHGTIYPAEYGYGPIEVDEAYLTKHRPEAGGYYVVYADGYKSFSPAKAFEDGYARV